MNSIILNLSFWVKLAKLGNFKITIYFILTKNLLQYRYSELKQQHTPINLKKTFDVRDGMAVFANHLYSNPAAVAV